MLKYATMVFCALSSTLLANYHPAPGGWSVTGEYLYLKPSVDDTYFVINASADTEILTGSRINNKLDYSSGFRVGGAFGLCECDRDLSIYYTWLDSNHKRHISGSHLSPTVGVEDYVEDSSLYTGDAHSKVDLKYQRLDGLFTQKLFCCGGFDVRAVLGFEWAEFKFNQTNHYDPTSGADYSGVTHNHAKTWGIGPQVGFEFDYELCQWACSCDCPGTFNLNVFSTGSLLVGENKSKVRYDYTSTTTPSDAAVPYNLSVDKETRIIPAFHAKISLNYDFCWCEYSGSVGVGYEFNTYVKSLSKTTNNGYYGYDGLTTTSYNNLDLQGLFVSFTFGF